MPRYDLDRNDYLRRMGRRHRWAWRMARIRKRLSGSDRPLLNDVYDRTFRSDLEAVTYHYAVKNDHLPDFENPRWVNEKIRWQFIHHPNPLMTLASDKVGVRDYLKLKGAEIRPPELYGVFTDGAELASADLPQRFVLKSAFGCGQNHFIDEAQPIRRRAIADRLASLSAWDHWRLLAELHYRGIPKRWLAEENVGPAASIREYKFYCLHGQPIFVLYITDRVSGRFRHALYDLNWGRVDFHWSGHPESAERVARPAAFELMVAEAKRLSEDFLHVRVDFLEQGGRVFFSELTFSGGGARNPFVPQLKNEVLGEMLDLGRADEILQRGRAIAAALTAGPDRAVETPMTLDQAKRA